MDDEKKNFLDGDYYQSDWEKSGVLEADCLICHIKGYNWQARALAVRGGFFYEAPMAGAGWFRDLKKSTPSIPSESPRAVLLHTDYTQTKIADPANLAEFLTREVADANCWNCHAMADVKKRGRTWKPETDVHKAKEKAAKVLVVYGGKFCYVNADEPTRTMQKIIEEQGPGVARIQATHCMDMIAGEAERELIAKEIAGDEKVWWMTPGWIQFRHKVFKGWDKGLANENFPRHTGGAIVLDGIGYVDRYMAEQPEEFLEYSDWMGIPIQGYPVTLDRLKSLLVEQARILSGS